MVQIPPLPSYRKRMPHSLAHRITVASLGLLPGWQSSCRSWNWRIALFKRIAHLAGNVRPSFRHWDNLFSSAEESF